MVKVLLSVTCAEKPDMEMDALAGKVLVRAPYAREPWLLLLTPWPAVYKKVSEVGRFLLFWSHTTHGDGGGGGGTGAGQIGHAASFG